MGKLWEVSDLKGDLSVIKKFFNSELLSNEFAIKIQTSLKEFSKIANSEIDAYIAFSGGKDSHAVLGVYLLYLALNNKPLDLVVKFADTRLEHETIYNSVNRIKKFLKKQQIVFELVIGKHSYWYYQFAVGYPVPNWRNRWCTGRLKVTPMEKEKRKPVTGAHLGESQARDNRLKKGRACGGESCGTDLIKKAEKFEPISHWDNDDVWVFLLIIDGILFPEGTFNQLQKQYAVAADRVSGSLRMGCIMCPVVGRGTIAKNVKDGIVSFESLQLRDLLDELNTMRRIKSPTIKKAGAIYIVDRRFIWSKIKAMNLLDYLLEHDWITQEDIKVIDKALKSDYSYPPTYPKDWINKEHQRMEKIKIGVQLELFNREQFCFRDRN